MYKKYLVNGKIEELYINKVGNTATWWHPKKEIDVNYKINTDKEGRKFIVMKGATVYLDENLTLTLEECKQLAKHGELKKDDFLNTVLKVGVDQVQLDVPCHKIEGYFLGAIKNYSERVYCKKCVFDETNYLRKIEDNYKVNIRCIEEGYECRQNDWYVIDLISAINDGYIKIL